MNHQLLAMLTNQKSNNFIVYTAYCKQGPGIGFENQCTQSDPYIHTLRSVLHHVHKLWAILKHSKPDNRTQIRQYQATINRISQ